MQRFFKDKNDAERIPLINQAGDLEQVLVSKPNTVIGEAGNAGLFQYLPRDVVALMVSYLKPGDAFQFSTTCQYLKSIVHALVPYDHNGLPYMLNQVGQPANYSFIFAHYQRQKLQQDELVNISNLSHHKFVEEDARQTHDTITHAAFRYPSALGAGIGVIAGFATFGIAIWQDVLTAKVAIVSLVVIPAVGTISGLAGGLFCHCRHKKERQRLAQLNEVVDDSLSSAEQIPANVYRVRQA